MRIWHSIQLFLILLFPRLNCHLKHRIFKIYSHRTGSPFSSYTQGKAVSASFVSASSCVLFIAEVLRFLNGGIRYEKIVAH